MRHISLKDFQDILKEHGNDADILFLNVCTREEFATQHIAGVKNIPLDELSQHQEAFKDKKALYIHCRSGKRSDAACVTLENLGFTGELFSLEGGLLAWTSAGLPIHRLNNALPLRQQIFLCAGILILLGVFCTVFFGNIFLIIPCIVGIGMTISGTTGWCGMELLLKKMPWNRGK